MIKSVKSLTNSRVFYKKVKPQKFFKFQESMKKSNGLWYMLNQCLKNLGFWLIDPGKFALKPTNH